MLSFTSQKTQTDSERLAWLRLIRTKNVGVVTFKKLVSRYGSAEKAIEALPDLAKRGGASKPAKLPDISVIEKELNALHKIGGRVMLATDYDYPQTLTNCSDAPPVLSVLGDTKYLQQNCIAIVGARNASLNGRKFAEKLARDLGDREHSVASGLARGIDTAAHTGSLPTGTIAVVAGGIDVIYPEENSKLYEQIKENGVILAESALGQKPFRESFPRRNRIVSGLSKGTVVVEATMRSGSLITARLAGEQGRDVFAVPGHPFDPRASGPNALIRDGATLIRGCDDVLENLISFEPRGLFDNAQEPLAQDFIDDSDIPDTAHDEILMHLSHQPVQINDLVRLTHMSVPMVQTILLDLELAGKTKRTYGNRVALIG